MTRLNLSRLHVILISLLITASSLSAQVTLECDFASSKNQRQPMHYHWNISNRISPIRGFNMPIGEKPLITVVRPLGGKSKKGEKLIAEDTYKWDGENYVYDWEPLKKQIDNVNKNARLYQLLIDNAPWAFLRGVDLKGEPEVETYGNAWPPNDPRAWARYIRAMMRELVSHYGLETVQQWRFCIGREVGTKGHWRGTREEFFEHYRITAKAIRSVLPEAKLGTHFLWASSKNSYGPDFVKWCKNNNVHYDFVGLSYYPFYHRKKRVDLEYVYQADFAPVKDIPEWNPAARLEIHEFALIKSMSSRGNSFDNAPNPHREAFTVMLAKMMYEHEMFDVFRWGTGKDHIAEQALIPMEDNLYFTSSKSGQPKDQENMIDAIFAFDEFSQQYRVMVYSYHLQPEATQSEPVTILTKLPYPANTKFQYRHAHYQDEKLSWSDWKTLRSTASELPNRSELELPLHIEPFSFQKLELRPPPQRPQPRAKVTRTLTQKRTGAQTEVKLIALQKNQLICYANGERYLIPLASLTQEDVNFIRNWAK